MELSPSYQDAVNAACTPLDVALSADTTLTIAELEGVGLVRVTPASAKILTLPSAVYFKYRKIRFICLAAFAITLTPEGSETINGGASFALMDAAYDTITIWSDGSNWFIIDRYIS